MGELKAAVLSFYGFEEVRGGTEIFVEHLRRAFPDLVRLTYSDARGRMDLDLNRLNLEEQKMGLAISREFLRRHRREDFDLVIANSIAGWYLSLARPNIPMINVYHYTLRGMADQVLRGTPGYLPSKYFGALFEKLSSRGKRCVAVSHKVRRELETDYGVTSKVIEHGIPADRFRPVPREDAREMLGIKGDGPLGIFVGRADHTKGFDILKAVAARRRDVRFLCVTSSDARDDDLLVRRNVPNEEMPLCYSAADFMLLPTRYESVGYSALEAMACNIPVIVSRTGVFEDMDQGPVGRIVGSWDPDDYARAIDEVLDRDDLRPRSLVLERFSMDRFAENYRLVAKEVVAGHRDDGPKGLSNALPRL